MKKSPAFQFYPADYLASQRVQMMTLEEEGAYIRLICYCWLHGSIPDNDEQIARLIGKGASTTLATTVKAMFNQTTIEGKLVHDRLEAERLKQAEWSKKSSEGGKKSAEIRKGGSSMVQPPYQPKGNTISSSISSSSSIEVKKEDILVAGATDQKQVSFKQWTKEKFFEICSTEFDGILPEEEAKAFFQYWIEPNPRGKMKFQLQETWDTKGRMRTWRKNYEEKQAKKGAYGNR